MIKYFSCAFLFLNTICLSAQDTAVIAGREADFDVLWQELDANYAYFDKKTTDWLCVKTIYRPQIKNLKSRDEWVRFLENVLYELYDDHINLNTNLPDSRQLVPSGTDIWAEWQGEKAMITALRKGFGAEKCGLKIGMEITDLNGKPLKETVQNALPHCVNKTDKTVLNWTLRNILAGTHDKKRMITVKMGENKVDFKPDEEKGEPSVSNPKYQGLVEGKILPTNIGYIRINNCLFDNHLIPAFDSVLLSMKNTKGLILDMRETASGGNSLVATGILGRFIEKEMPYQKYYYPSDEKSDNILTGSLDLAIPRKGWHYDKPLVVLVNRWTGSMGEGIAIGLDAMKRATIVGTAMAGLNGGATGGLQLEKTNIHLTFPTTKIFHINGTPREDFLPEYNIDLSLEKPYQDLILERGLEILRKY